MKGSIHFESRQEGPLGGKSLYTADIRQGKFVAFGMKPGTYDIKCYVNGRRLYTPKTDEITVVKDAQEPVEIGVEVAEQTMQVGVTVINQATNKPMKDAAIQLRPVGAGQRVTRISDMSGKARIEEVEYGEYRVRVFAPGYALFEQVLKGELREEVRAELVKTHKINTQFLDPEGKPATGWQIGWVVRQGRFLDFKDAIAGEDGNVELNDVVGGAGVPMIAIKDGETAYAGRPTVVVGEPLHIKLKRPQTLTGSILCGAVKERPARILLFDANPHVQASVGLIVKDGKFKIGCPRGDIASTSIQAVGGTCILAIAK